MQRVTESNSHYQLWKSAALPPNSRAVDEHVTFAPADGARRQCACRRGGRPGGAVLCAKVVATTVCRPAPGGHNVGMIVMTTMRADLG
jgi:hypothetical protein